MGKLKVVVEVVGATELPPKDGSGSASAYVVVDLDGQRKRTSTQQRKLDPVWNEALTFEVDAATAAHLHELTLQADVFHARPSPGRAPAFLGRVRVGGSHLVRKGEEALIYFPLQKRAFFNFVKGQLGLRVHYVDVEEPPPVAEPTPSPTDAGSMEPPSAQEPKTSDAKPPEPPASASEPNPANVASTEPAPSAEPKPTEDATPQESAQAVEPAPRDAPPPESVPAAEPKLPETPPVAPPAEQQAATEATKMAEGKATEQAKPDQKDDNKVAEQVQQVPEPEGHPAVTDCLTKGSFGGVREKPSASYALVEKMQYLFVRIVKARTLPLRDADAAEPFAKVRVGSFMVKTRPATKTVAPEWKETFAFGKERIESAPTLEISVWDRHHQQQQGQGEHFVGGVCFDLSEVPLRAPHDSPLAPQWYRLDGGGGGGDIMLAVWMGTQADDAYADAAGPDAAAHSHTRAKVYLSPKLWYLRVGIIDAQDLRLQPDKVRNPDLRVRAQLGLQVLRTRKSCSRFGSAPFWNEDLLFVAAEPFEEVLILTAEERSEKEAVHIGHSKVPLTAIERRVDERTVASRWLDLKRPQAEAEATCEGGAVAYSGRMQVRLCFDGGYHVMDEAAQLCSDLRPTAKQLWRAPVGMLELGIVGASNLVPMKTKVGRGSTDAYCVAKYGHKWIRTRTITDSFHPRWNEQYTWPVHDPCTVLTLGVFDNWYIFSNTAADGKTAMPDSRIGKVRIRISTLETNRVYTNSYPLIVVLPSGVKKMGDIDLAVRFSCVSYMDLLQLYTQPMLPRMHHVQPLGAVQQELLRNTAMKIVALRLSRSEPPLKQEVVHYMLDAESCTWSMRRSRVNWSRLLALLAGPLVVVRWLHDMCMWRNPVTTLLVHALLGVLACYPELLPPTLLLYVSLLGCWAYRSRPRSPTPMPIPALDCDDPDEEEEQLLLLDEEPQRAQADDDGVVRSRYDRLRMVAARIQNVLGHVAAQGERVQSLLSWRDPRATGMFLAVCCAVALFLYMVPLRVAVVVLGLYLLRHPRFRHAMPPAFLNFFRRLPSLSDRLL